MRSKMIAVILLLLCSVTAGSTPAWATEVIRSFHSDIIIGSSGELTVTETIKVSVEGVRFKHGIYRDLPQYLSSNEGSSTRLLYRIVSVQRNGVAEPFHQVYSDNQLRIYIGKADKLLEPGEHSFRLTYATDGDWMYTQGGFVWNVNGSWDFRIESASATLKLATGISIETVAAHTRRADGVLRLVDILRNEREIRFIATAPLEPNERMTIGLILPRNSSDTSTQGTEP